MLKRREFECQFGVGTPNGNHSMVWKVWANRHTPDVYITARSMGRSLKTSIHAQERHVGFTGEHVREALARGDWEGGSRHWDIWNGGYQLEGGYSLEYLLRFPTSELRPFPLKESDLNKTVWVPPAPSSEAVEIGLFFLPHEAVFSGEGAESQQLIGAGRLADGRQVWLVSRTTAMFAVQAEAFQEIADQLQARGVDPSAWALDNGKRLILLFNVSGVRGWIEMAFDSVTNSRP